MRSILVKVSGTGKKKHAQESMTRSSS